MQNPNDGGWRLDGEFLAPASNSLAVGEENLRPGGGTHQP
jgi:hypothetical protein